MVRLVCCPPSECYFGIYLGPFMFQDFYLRSSNWIINVKLHNIQLSDCAVFIIWQCFGSVTLPSHALTTPGVTGSMCQKQRIILRTYKLTSTITKNGAPGSGRTPRGLVVSKKQTGRFIPLWMELRATHGNIHQPRVPKGRQHLQSESSA